MLGAQALLEEGAQASGADKEGFTPLHRYSTDNWKHAMNEGMNINVALKLVERIKPLEVYSLSTNLPL